MTSSSTRREFLRRNGFGLAAAACGGLSGSCFRAAAEPALPASAPKLPIIDTHTHFYDPTRPQGVPWPSKNETRLYRKVMPADYEALEKPSPVAGTVVIEASEWLEDNQWILDLAAKNPFLVGFVGHLPFTSEEFPRHLRRFAANPVFRGIRIGGDGVKAALAGGAAGRNLRLLADLDLSLDLLIGPEMLEDVPRLAAAAPRLRMLIDHVANVRIDGRVPPRAWTDGMKAAGANPNIYCKVSGLVEGSGRNDGKAPADPEFYRPILDGIWAAFGADRLVYGSNWPVSAQFAPCATVQSIAAAYFQEKGPAALIKCFHQNSKSFYQWSARAPGQEG